jgi:hypothetical protein
MLSVKVQQRVNMKFVAKLGKFAIETYSLLMEVYGDEYLFRTQVFELFRRFKEGRGEIEDQVKFQSKVPEGETVNQAYYKVVLTVFCERVRRRRPEMWKKG